MMRLLVISVVVISCLLTSCTNDNPANSGVYDTHPLYGMKYIPGGTFLMGDSEYGSPVHVVTVSSFYMDSTEVTQAEFRRLMGLELSPNSSSPAERLSWFDAVLYCNARSKFEGKDTVYAYSSVSGSREYGYNDLTDITIHFDRKGYRLPTEAEWEYAYRGGTTTLFYWSNTWDQSESNKYCWNRNNASTAQPVAGKLPNAFGLYDMAGNVYEWCNDWYGDYDSTAQLDPFGPLTGSERVMRGGFWVHTFSIYFQAGHRCSVEPDFKINPYGFRVVCKANDTTSLTDISPVDVGMPRY
ncbi:MAG: SUMF1/EgtB/PvdO family nonheme iron enzyme [Fibrobacteres bacterium]|nr:SUMF1/EgtB/PvdO family nonheme iron enzyme [Fibrobacterota bacterium]